MIMTNYLLLLFVFYLKGPSVNFEYFLFLIFLICINYNFNWKSASLKSYEAERQGPLRKLKLNLSLF